MLPNGAESPKEQAQRCSTTAFHVVARVLLPTEPEAPCLADFLWVAAAMVAGLGLCVGFAGLMGVQ